MDALDTRILRELFQGQAISPLNPEFRESYAAIARKVGADQDTVRNRVKKLHETGFIGDWGVLLNPRLWGGGQVLVWFDTEPAPSRDDLVEKLELVPGIFLINCSFGTWVALVLAYDDEPSLRKRVELIRKLSNAPEIGVARISYPDCDLTLSTKDKDLIRALQRSPRKPYSALAKEVRLSTRTVARKLTKLTRSGAIFAFPAINPKGVRDGVLAILFIFYPSERKNDIDQKIITRLEGSLWHILHLSPLESGGLQPCFFNLMVPNIQRAQEILSWAEELEGVQRARIILHDRIVTLFEPLGEDLEKKMGRMLALESRIH